MTTALVPNEIMPNEVFLVHHGILGMKWGIRRFQNPDGSLTPAGQARYNKAAAKFEKKYGAKPSSEATSSTTSSKSSKTNYSSKNMISKSMDEMTTDELKNISNRIRAEQEYAQLTAKKPSGWEKMMNNAKDKLIQDIPQIILNAGRSYVEKSLKDMQEEDKKNKEKEKKNNEDKKNKEKERAKQYAEKTEWQRFAKKYNLDNLSSDDLAALLKKAKSYSELNKDYKYLTDEDYEKFLNRYD